MKDKYTITYTIIFDDDGPDELKTGYSGTKKECAFLMQKISGISNRPIKSCFVEIVPSENKKRPA